MYDTVFSGKFYYNGSFSDLDIGIENGIITAIKKHISSEKKVLKNAIIPAGTDTHVHFRDPGETESEDFSTGTISALFGGTTTVFDMPNNRVKIDNYSTYRDKLEIVRRKAYCDFGLYSMFTGNNFNIISRESSGIKIYLGDSTNTPGGYSFNESDIRNIDKMNIPVYFHAEDASCLAAHKKAAPGLKEYCNIRPEKCEEIAIENAGKMGFKMGVITHMSHYYPTGYIKEVTPHHLMLNYDMPLGSYGKVNPPLRSEKTQADLMDRYKNNEFNIISSDHAPHTQNEKMEFEYAKSGIIGVETRMPLMLALVQKKIISFNTFYNTCIYNPAKLFGLRKGELRLGYYADFMSVDFSEMKRLNDYNLHSKNPVSPFNGFETIFPGDVILRGEMAIEGHELVNDRRGKYTNELKNYKIE
ncbi:MAG: dihydroorotase [Ferroplasma sp.]